MTHGENVLVYDDGFPATGAGAVVYPPSLQPVTPFLAELNGEAILAPREFNANIQLYLDLILGRFASFHDTHAAAKRIYGQYRAEGRQYCVYLRSFVWAGVVLRTDLEQGRIFQQVGFSGQDRAFRSFLKRTLPRGVASLSFINTFDLYPSGNEDGHRARRDMARVTIPSFRVLSHNWKEVVRHVVRGARLIVMNAWGESEGVEHEMELIRECGMAERTIVTGRALSRSAMASTEGFYAIVDLGDPAVLTGGQARALAQTVRSLAADSAPQTNGVADLSELRCWVVDRGIDRAAELFDPQTVARTPYDYFVPSSMLSNWQIMTERFPQMVAGWRSIEAQMEKGGTLSVERLANVLYLALSVFYVATTLERYYEMAMSLSTMGMAHRAITGEVQIMATCYRHAARCAKWLGDDALTRFLSQAHAGLVREIAARG
jgi:hypothetical protein